MKVKILCLLVAIILVGCRKDESENTGDDSQKSVKIRISMNQTNSKGVEPGHPGSSGTLVVPDINSVTVYAYNDYGKLISQLDLSKEQRTAALYGADGLPATSAGTTIGLPVGTKKIDVVLNNPSNLYSSISDNINYYNYRQGEEPTINGKPDFPTGTIYNRAFLTTDMYGIGYDLSSLTLNVKGEYEGDFTVKPMLSRFEIYNSVNIRDKEEYKDNHKQSWKIIDAVEFLAHLKLTNPAIVKIEDVLRPKDELDNKFGIIGPEEVKESATVTKNYYYIPAHYWFPGTAQVETPQEFVEANAADMEETKSEWVKSPYYSKLTTILSLQWYPNIYHAVDVEEIFINNIKVRNATLDPYLHTWPGADKVNGWPHWYKAFHPFGWHTGGSSADNSFLCMGNVWDRIADSNGKLIIDWKKASLSIPGLIGTDQLEMHTLTGKAIPVAEKSEYGDAIGSRNLGVITDKAAAYHFYPQSATSTNKDILANSLPHVILKVKCYSTAEDYKLGKAVGLKDFVTIKLFTSAAHNTDYIKKFERGSIYRINLLDLVSSFKGPVPVPGSIPDGGGTDYIPDNPVDPDPEMPGSQVNVKVKVVPWKIQNIYPGIH